MTTEIDWDSEPKGYPVWVVASGESKFSNKWYKEECDRFVDPSGFYWLKSDKNMFTVHRKPETSINWNGEGLPLVGVYVSLSEDCFMCRFDDCKKVPKGTEVFVGGHANFGGDDVAVIHHEDDVGIGYTATLCKYMEPIKTPEQIAEEERSTACNKIYEVLNSTMRAYDLNEMSEALYDAGYRKMKD